jgi:diaminopimelate epimerase
MDFVKYSCNGNDFIVLDQLKTALRPPSKETIQIMCHRRFGIGADGILILSKSQDFDFAMVYFNADGGRAEMCGNGARGLCHYFYHHHQAKPVLHFTTDVGPFEARMDQDRIALKFSVNTNPQKVSLLNLEAIRINTGVPHLVVKVPNLNDGQFEKLAPLLRSHLELPSEGQNVDFITIDGDKKELSMRVFERGVEDETYSSGTGVIACAKAYEYWQGKVEVLKVKTKGGDFKVTIDENNDMWLAGETDLVFKGSFSKPVQPV